MIGAARLWAPRMFAERYWPKVGASAFGPQHGTLVVSDRLVGSVSVSDRPAGSLEVSDR